MVLHDRNIVCRAVYQPNGHKGCYYPVVSALLGLKPRAAGLQDKHSAVEFHLRLLFWDGLLGCHWVCDPPAWAPQSWDYRRVHLASAFFIAVGVQGIIRKGMKRSFFLDLLSKSQRSTCLCLSSAGVKDVHHPHPALSFMWRQKNLTNPRLVELAN